MEMHSHRCRRLDMTIIITAKHRIRSIRVRLISRLIEMCSSSLMRVMRPRSSKLHTQAMRLYCNSSNSNNSTTHQPPHRAPKRRRRNMEKGRSTRNDSWNPYVDWSWSEGLSVMSPGPQRGGVWKPEWWHHYGVCRRTSACLCFDMGT